MTEFFSQDNDLDFWENMGDQAPQEPEAAPEEGTPAEVVEQTPVAEAETVEEETSRPRDESGRFVKQETEEKLFAGKFKSPDDLERAYTELQSRFGSQSNELGDLRQQVDERFANLEAANTRATTPWDELIEENPAQALALAHQQGDEFNMRRAATAWEEVSPGSVNLWAENVRLKEQMEQRFAALEERTKPAVEDTAEQARVRAYTNAKNRHPDMEQHIAQMQEVSVQFPMLVTAIETGTQEEREKGWEALYLLTKAGNADNLQQTAQQVARNAADAEQRAREEAAVVSAATVPGQKPKSLSERIGDEWASYEDPLAAGWNI